MTNQLELTAFDVLASINSLRHEAGDIYIQEPTGVKFIKTPLGFQTVNQFNNSELIRKSTAIDCFLKSQGLKYDPESHTVDHLSKRSKIRKQLCRLLESPLTDGEKVQIILTYLKTTINNN